MYTELHKYHLTGNLERQQSIIWCEIDCLLPQQSWERYSGFVILGSNGVM
jgi:hypothetical protein